MATIKSHTDLSQSKKLADILPLESADIYYFLDPTPAGNIYHLVIQQIDFGLRTREPEYDKGDIPCWSLAALFSVLDFPSLTQNKEDEWEVCVPNHQFDGYIEVLASNPVDACYEMIIRLSELNLL